MIATNQQQPDRGAPDRAIVGALVGGQHQRLHRRRQRHRQQLGHVFAGALAGSRRLLQRRGRCGSRSQQRHALGQFDVGCVVAGRAIDQCVLAGVGDHLELVRRIAADRAGVGGHRAVLQAEAIEDAFVGREHHLVALQRRSLVAIERVGVLHRELAAAHQAESRPPLIAELGLDVIEVSRQLAIAAQLLTRDVGDDLFAGGLDHEVAFVAILDPQQFGTVGLEAPRLLPQLGGLHHRHQQFDRAGGVHLFADDRLDLADHAQAHRHVAVDAGTQALDEPGAQHQPMAHDLGVGRSFFQRGDEEAGGFHGTRPADPRACGKARFMPLVPPM